MTADLADVQPSPVPEQSGVSPAAKPRVRSYRGRALTVLLAVTLAIGVWWAAGYLFAYTDDAYVTSDLVSITPEVTGLIETVRVTDNQRVRRGEVLFTIDPVPFDLDLSRSRAQEAQAQAQLPVDQADYAALQAQAQAAGATAALASSDLTRDLPLGQSGYVSAQALDRTRSAQAQTAAQQHAAKAVAQKSAQTLRLHQVAVQAARAARQLAEWRRSRTEVIAPVDGFVTHLTLQPGDMASTSHPVAAIVDAQAWRVIANYKEYYLRHLAPGHTAWVWLDTHPWRLYRARIQGLAHGVSRDVGDEQLVPYVSPTVNWIRLQRRIPVRLTLIDPPPDAQMFMGADARVLAVY